ncbi:NADH:ubiquinone oxidoreductase-like protein 1 [Leptotrombidium deliense]|uniref:NADH:ubiquinone oxidoreductase-like protein 1 n=1 Tax=Leptotrombidium deliense TaxID=299467 RepID=A0A443SWW7_9ACAR|nr:NADH:ubiquinone oxidoreductase-like protein 1 [Leptotrombidium deliense]
MGGGGHGHHVSDPALQETEKRVAQILARASVAKPRDYPWPSSVSGGVMPMRISSRFRQERQRLSEDFTDKWRKWRVQFIKDQELHPSEPLYIKQYEHDINNIFRRIYKIPGNYFEAMLKPKFGADMAHEIRCFIFRAPLVWLAAVSLWYTWKYSHNTWESPRQWNCHYSKPAVYPGDPNYPLENPRPNKWQFADCEFSKRQVFREVQK